MSHPVSTVPSHLYACPRCTAEGLGAEARILEATDIAGHVLLPALSETYERESGAEHVVTARRITLDLEVYMGTDLYALQPRSTGSITVARITACLIGGAKALVPQIGALDPDAPGFVPIDATPERVGYTCPRCNDRVYWHTVPDLQRVSDLLALAHHE